MPPVRVELVEKQRLDNHRPEFRPTDSAKLYGSERTLATAVNRIAEAIPTSLVVDYIYGRVAARNLTRRIVDLVQDDPTMIEKPVFAGFQVGEVDEAAQERKDLNRRLRELGANVRLRSTGELRKALDEVVWEPPYLGSFDVTDPNAPGRIHARIQSQRILTDLSRSTVDAIDTIVQNSFRVTQTFSTGRTVAGLTPTQTAASIFTALDEIGPPRPVPTWPPAPPSTPGDCSPDMRSLSSGPGTLPGTEPPATGPAPPKSSKSPTGRCVDTARSSAGHAPA